MTRYSDDELLLFTYRGTIRLVTKMEFFGEKKMAAQQLAGYSKSGDMESKKTFLIGEIRRPHMIRLGCLEDYPMVERIGLPAQLEARAALDEDDGGVETRQSVIDRLPDTLRDATEKVWTNHISYNLSMDQITELLDVYHELPEKIQNLLNDIFGDLAADELE